MVNTIQAPFQNIHSGNFSPFPALELENRPFVSTAQAAYYMGRRPQTLRSWACFENGALRPHRIHGRLAWSVADIRSILGVQQ